MFTNCMIAKIVGYKTNFYFTRALSTPFIFAMRRHIKQRRAGIGIKLCYFNPQVPIVEPEIGQIEISLTNNIFKGIIQSDSRFKEIIYGKLKLLAKIYDTLFGRHNYRQQCGQFYLYAIIVI